MTKLTDFSANPDLIYEYRFNAVGNRIMSKSPVKTETFVYDGLNVIADYDNSATNDLLRTYFSLGVDENYLVIDEGTTDKFYYFKDGLGSITELTDAAPEAQKQNIYRYKGFGENLYEYEISAGTGINLQEEKKTRKNIITERGFIIQAWEDSRAQTQRGMWTVRICIYIL